MRRSTTMTLLGAAAGAVLSLAGAASAATCVGTCGNMGADGDISLSPDGGTYDYISTAGGVAGAGQIAGVEGGTNGSEYTSSAFDANAGDLLEFFFNFVTSDGAGFSDYGWAELVDESLNHVAWLFTARTQPSGNTSPGFGLPRNDSTLTPASSEIVAGAPTWSALGASSDRCYAAGCGYTDWIKSEYTIKSAGTYLLRFGVTNSIDTGFDTGMAFDGAKIGGVVIDPTEPSPVPLPASSLLLGAGLMGLAGARARRKA